MYMRTEPVWKKKRKTATAAYPPRYEEDEEE
jgi:hypothetical protein